MRIEYHRTLIADAPRNAAFYAALKSVIVPGKSVVVDIGAGTGLLGILAAKLGAREVFLFETAAVAGVAREILKANRVRNCHLIPCHSTEFNDTLAADIIVSETLGNYALEENIVDTLNDARQRFLKKGGHVIPRRIRQFIAPVTADRVHKELSVWNDAGAALGVDLDLSVAREMSFNNVYVRSLEPAELKGGMADAVAWDDVDLTRKQKATRRGEATWVFQKAETVYGFCVWWTAELSDGIVLSTAPDAPRSHWEQLYFPLAAPFAMTRGQRLQANLQSRSSEEGGTHLAWSATQMSDKGNTIAKVRHDLDRGYLP